VKRELPGRDRNQEVAPTQAGKGVGPASIY
jgi:hypothetical protein